jgi:hypothetical protein
MDDEQFSRWMFELLRHYIDALHRLALFRIVIATIGVAFTSFVLIRNVVPTDRWRWGIAIFGVTVLLIYIQSELHEERIKFEAARTLRDKFHDHLRGISE